MQKYPLIIIREVKKITFLNSFLDYLIYENVLYVAYSVNSIVVVESN